MSEDYILECKQISKEFPGVQALDAIDLKIQRGEIHAIVGENGAGKSTLMKIIAGLYRPDGGKIFLNGNPIAISNAHEALKLGIAMVPQELNLVPELSVGENILLNIEPRRIFGVLDTHLLHRQASEVLASLGVGIDTFEKVKNLTVAQQQMVQIARATVFQCNILIMDEPTASLSQRETETLFGRIRSFREKGATVIYISHRLKEVFDIADRITVLRDGNLIKTIDTKGVTEDDIIRLMIGRSLSEFRHPREMNQTTAATTLEVRGLTCEGVFQDISFQLHRGEILGIAGLVGAGRSEVFASIFGFKPIHRGEILVNGKPAKIKSPADAIRLGIGYVPEERKRLGLFLLMSVLHNMTIPFVRRFQRYSLVNNGMERHAGQQLKEQLRVSTPTLAQKIENLSGGNQQKVILARWLGSGSDIIILDEPTRGIDVNAKAEIHALISSLAGQGKSVVLISSELQEIINLSDRILVIKEGQIVGEADPKQGSEEDILRLAMGGQPGNPFQGHDLAI